MHNTDKKWCSQSRIQLRMSTPEAALCFTICCAAVILLFYSNNEVNHYTCTRICTYGEYSTYTNGDNGFPLFAVFTNQPDSLVCYTSRFSGLTNVKPPVVNIAFLVFGVVSAVFALLMVTCSCRRVTTSANVDNVIVGNAMLYHAVADVT